MNRILRSILLLLGLVIPTACENPVKPTPAATVSLGEPRIYVVPGQELQLTADVRDSQGRELTDRPVAWKSLAPPVASVTSSGLLTAHRVGSVRVEATVDGVIGSVEVYVMDDGLHVWPDTSAMRPGETRELAARAREEKQSARVLSGILWDSSDPTVAVVDTAGVVTAMGEGHATITAIAGPTRLRADVYVLPEPEHLRFASVTVGGDWRGLNSCGLTAEGQAYCWGESPFGVLSSEQPTDRCERWTYTPVGTYRQISKCSEYPVPVGGALRFETMSLGPTHVCGIVATGEAYCWGSNAVGQLGSGIAEDRSAVAQRVATEVPLRSIAAGESTTCAISTAGEAYCWGSGSSGRLGSGDEEDSFVPVPVVGGLSFEQLDVGYAHACGVASDSAVYCWGRNVSGELGVEGPPEGCGRWEDVDCARQPVRVMSETAYQEVGTGTFFTCARTVAGNAECWGSGSHGKLGHGESESHRVPEPVLGSTQFTTLRVGDTRTCGLDVAGATHCWGYRVLQLDGARPLITDVPTRSAPALALATLDVHQILCGITLEGVTICEEDYSAEELRPVPGQ